MLLRQSADLHDPSKHGAIDATFYERSAASRHYCQRTIYRVQKLKVTKLVDTDSQAVLANERIKKPFWERVILEIRGAPLVQFGHTEKVPP